MDEETADVCAVRGLITRPRGDARSTQTQDCAEGSVWLALKCISRRISTMSHGDWPTEDISYPLSKKTLPVALMCS